MSFWDKLLGTDNEEWNKVDSDFRARHRADAGEYDQVRPAYQYGYAAARDASFEGRSFEEAEPELRKQWSGDLAAQSGEWDSVRGFVGQAYGHSREIAIPRVEEELAIGKRAVQTGEVGVRKTVETERVTQSVPVTREQVTVERHAVEPRLATAADLQAQGEIRVPVREEEVVVEKRPVVKEEVVLRTEAVQDTRNVQADVRKERIDIDDTRATTDRTRTRTDLDADADLR